jgi:hypothetical protein
MEHSKALGLAYQYYPNLDKLVFEDGVCYTTEEAFITASMNPETIRAAHLVKKLFGGELIRESVGKSIEEQDKSWFELIPPVLDSDPSPVVRAGSVRAGFKPAPTKPDAEILTLDL